MTPGPPSLPAHDVSASGRVYSVVDDLTIRRALVVAGRVVDASRDELWQGPLSARVLGAAPSGLSVHANGRGYFAVLADVGLAFPLLGVLGAGDPPYGVTIALRAPGLRPRELRIEVGEGATLPLADLEQRLIRQPIVLAGRVVEATAARAPIPGASIRLTTPTYLLLRTPLHFDHSVGTPVRVTNLSPIGLAKTVSSAVRSGNDTLALSDVAGLAAGSVVRVGATAAFEFVRVLSVDAATGTVRLSGGMTRTFAAGTPAQPVSPAPAGPSAALADDVFALGGVLRLNVPLSATNIQVGAGASSGVEYHSLGGFSGADGFYRFSGVDRPALGTLEAAAGGFPTANVAIAPDFSHPVNSMEIEL